jgi:hypothetical protein
VPFSVVFYARVLILGKASGRVGGHFGNSLPKHASYVTLREKLNIANRLMLKRVLSGLLGSILAATGIVFSILAVRIINARPDDAQSFAVYLSVAAALALIAFFAASHLLRFAVKDRNKHVRNLAGPKSNA